MGLKYEINMFETDPDDASKTFVTLVDAQIVKAAQTAAQSEIDTWVSQVANVGKTWNPDTESIE